MDRFEDRYWLDWWVNPITLLGSVEVDVAVTVADDGTWEASGNAVLEDDENPSGFALLCDLDPVFTLRFTGRSTIDVIVHPADKGCSFVFTDHT
ncbi:MULTISPECIES: hypothetical protein [unclassified Micromonospora]|uniref:hypothetical protein n=1 Tax=Micromonospora TaxID=1873 RepID=UPI0024173C22|nr:MULTISPECIES: hypothetical protein [unclassified Micromonospora]MDG4815902.1 hypothetical protein [Micromonospora sp. WMMD956]WFE58440.1 hypothetical protein O7633_16980 [Micromonospora sp. WMMD712]